MPPRLLLTVEAIAALSPNYAHLHAMNILEQFMPTMPRLYELVRACGRVFGQHDDRIRCIELTIRALRLQQNHVSPFDEEMARELVGFFNYVLRTFLALLVDGTESEEEAAELKIPTFASSLVRIWEEIGR